VKKTLLSAAALACFVMSAAFGQTLPKGDSKLTKAEATLLPGSSSDAAPTSHTVSFTRKAYSFEPNIGQSEPAAKYIAKGPGYTLELDASSAQLRFEARKGSEARTVTMEMMAANEKAAVAGEEVLPGKVSYFPTSDPKTWVSDIPTYSRVKYSSVYPGVDVEFYGNENRLEYDFILQPKADPGQIRMNLSGSDEARIDKDGNLILRVGKDDVRFLVPVAYQLSGDGKHRDPVSAAYRLENTENGKPALVSFSLGSYDRTRSLVIDPTVEALSFTEYLNGYAADVTVDGSGDTFVTGQNTNGQGFYVTEFNSLGVVVYNTTIGTSAIYPYRVRVDSTGKAYVAGYIYGGATLPTGSNSYKSSATGSYNGFLVQIAAGGASVPYATYISGGNSSPSAALGLGVETVSGVTSAFVAGWTYSSAFPVTTGAYQALLSGSGYNGWVARFNPAASGNASLLYSTYLGPSNSQINAVAVDAAGDAYVTGFSNSPTFPVTAGAFKYTGYDAADGGAYVTKLNPTGTALVYSAYLGYGTGYGIAVDGQATPNAYVTGTVDYDDFPTTAGAYQTDYPAGFVTKLSTDGSSEVYSTFLGGPSSYAGGNIVVPWSLALPYGCASSCAAFVSGYTSTTDFPAINALQAAASTSNSSAFVVELASTGNSALFSSYLSGLTGYVWDGAVNSNSYGVTPAIAVFGSGNPVVVGNLGGTSDFPVTLANANPAYAFLAKIALSTEPFTWSTPTSVTFSSQPVGISTSAYGTPPTVSIRNLSDYPVTISSIDASPADLFSAADSCTGTIPASGLCILTLNFTPAAVGVRTGTVSVKSNASNSPTVIAVTGTGYDTAFTATTTSSLSFGTQNVGTSSVPQTVTFTNTGDLTESLSVYAPYLGVDFTVLNSCSSPLAPGASCVMEVTFSPTQAGLRTGTLYIEGGGPFSNSIPLSGTGLASGVAGTVGFSGPALDFGTILVGSTTGYQAVAIENTGSVPVTISGITASGDFSLYSSTCGTLPVQLNLQTSCTVYVTFTPSASGLRTGNLTFADTATGNPQSVALSGTGLAGVKTLEFYPSAMADFGSNVPVGIQSGAITVYAQNAGTSPIAIDRVLVSGDFLITSTSCPTAVLAGTTGDGTGTLSYCSVNVNFLPTATGLRTGSLTFIDSAGNSPQTVSLSGNAIADTGTVALMPTQLDFNTMAVGTSSATQYVYITNPGDTTITINSYKTGTGNFSVINYDCPTLPFTITPGSGCYVNAQFNPAAAGALTDTLTVAGSVGSGTVALSGTGVAESKTIGFTPASPMNSGSVVVGQSSGAHGASDGVAGDLVSIRNTGTAAVSFTASPVIGGTNAADFTLYNPYGCANVSTKLQPGASCPLWITFKPSVASAEAATLTVSDDATTVTQVLTLNGTGVSANPGYYLSNNLVNFDNQVEGTTSPINTYVYFYNNSGAAVTMGNATLSAGFLVPSSGGQTCNGATIATGSSCYSYISFAPTTTGFITGTITFKNSTGTALVSAPLSGYAPAPILTGLLTPSTLNFTNQVVATTSSYLTTVFTNTGNVPLTVGTVSGVNLGAAPTNEFSIYSDGCSTHVISPGSNCTEYLEFTPNAAGARTGSLTIPVTYTGGTTGSFTANLTGSGISDGDTAVVQPGTGAFVDQAVGVQSPYVVTLYLVNQGNRPFKVATVTGVNTVVGVSGPGEFSASATQGGYDGCSGTTVAANTGSCQMNVTFTPSATGTRTGSMGFPITFADLTTTTVTASLTGNGVAAVPRLQFGPASLEFAPEIVSNTSTEAYIAVKNIGNATVHFSTIAAPSAGFILGPDQDGCFARSLNNLPVGATCYIYVSFAPTTTGNITGTLTVNDNATGGPHKIPLSGLGIPATQQIAISQTALTFANQPQGSTSSPQLIYVTNQSDSTVTSLSAVLGGTNAADFQLANACSTSLGARAVCTLTVKFAPASTATGTRTASIVLTDSDTGSPRTITLTGTATVPGPAASLAPPSPLTFPIQNVGTTSNLEAFSVTNTGTGNLVISGVALSGTNVTEFSIVSDGCSGATLTANQQCIVGIRFLPKLGGTRTAIATVTDNASGPAQTIGLSGTGYGIPIPVLSAGLLTYANTYVGTSTAAQSVTLTNSGTDTLKIASIAITGAQPTSFLTSNTCGTTLAPAANCTIRARFNPLAGGQLTAAITITDNAYNVFGATESIYQVGTGLIDTSSTPGSLNFASISFGTTKTLNVTVSNIGAIPSLTVSPAISGAGFVVLTTGNTCTTGVAPGKSCTLPIEFNPAVVGANSATLTVTTNGGLNPIIPLSGTATSDVSVSATTLAFGTITHGTTTTMNLTVSNVGTLPSLTVSTALSGANPTDFVILTTGNTCTTGVAPGGSCTLPVEFAPAAAASYAATLTITTNGGVSPTVSLTGTGN